MRPLLFKVPKFSQEAFRVQVDDVPYFYDPLHYHPELQLTVILKSTGTRFIGTNIGRFEPGDMFLIGSDLPHVFRNDKVHYEDNSVLKAQAISILFTQDALGAEFFNLPETQNIKALISKSSRGLSISGKLGLYIKAQMLEITKLSGIEKLTKFLHILDRLSLSEDLQVLSTLEKVSSSRKSDNEKIDNILNYVLQHFARKITLKEVANVADMSEQAFCRFFKKRTRKTFSLFLNEIRIGHACKLLVESRLNVGEICYASGFNNLSNFNRKFKEITRYTPREYKGMQKV